jgi:Icc-related predicted phosphoesterase
MSILSNSEESENTQSSDGVKFPFSCQNFANKINQIRFNIQKAFTFIQEKLREGITRGDKKISFLSINQEIEFDDEDLM